ncbi:PVC-type heme-binding CxxCH protein [Stieleria marina]
MLRSFAGLLTLVILVSIPGIAIGQDHGKRKPLVVDVQQRPKSDFPTLEFQRWSGKINVPDPVALSVDNRGVVYVTQTRRRKIQDLDIRANQDWIPDDVGMQSVTQKRSFYREQLAIDGKDPKRSERVADWNKDGKHDWRDLTVVSEAIYRLVDNNDDGTADQITTFAEDFKTEVTGIAAGVLAYQGDVYSTIAPDVWKLRDHDQDGVADSRSVLATGFGLHIAYGGHDMHGLTVGPDGKIYWSIGDKGINVQSAEGKTFKYSNQGGVMRCNPDGSDFEVFAHGLRNVQEFAFDQYGNLFGVDNDSDQPGEHERFVCIIDSMDAGWRCNYQYRGDSYNPWTVEKLWETAGDEHPAYIVPPIRYYVDGPAGFKFNPGTALTPEYRDFFFMTNAPAGFQYAFRVQPDGDSFKMTDSHQFGSGDAIVGLAFGPDGGLYGADWDGGYPLDEKGAVIRIDVPAKQISPEHKVLRQEVATLLRTGFTGHSVDELKLFLPHADRRIRLGAQFELVNREQATVLADNLADASADQLARLHCVWGLGQLARSGDELALQALQQNLSEQDPIVLAQIAKTVGEIPAADSLGLIDALSHPNLHVRVNVGLAIARHPAASFIPALLQQAEKLQPNQHSLRHSIVRALAASATSDRLAEQSGNQSVMVKMVCVLALRQQASPLVAKYLGDESAWIVAEAARAIHDDDSIANALPELAAALFGPHQQNPAIMRRAINANLRLGTAAHSDNLLTYMASQSPPTDLLVEACESIGIWNEPHVLDRVEGVYRDLTQTKREPLNKRAAATLTALVTTAATPVKIAAVIAARQQGIQLGTEALTTLLQAEEAPAQLRIEAMNTLAETKSPEVKKLLIEYTSSASKPLAARAIGLLAETYPADATKVLQGLLEQSKSITIQQASLSALTSIGNAKADQALAKFGSNVFAKDDSFAMLEIAQAVATRAQQSSELSRLQRVVNQKQLDQTAKFKLGNAPGASKFAFSLSGGDKQNGEKIFKTHLQAQCSRCHRIGKSGSNIGPELTKIAKQRDTVHLLRAIVNPSADIDPKYFTQAILMDSGKIIRGVIKHEGDETTIVIGSDGKENEIASEEIEDISSQKISLMPDMTETLTANEVRDLVAYLSSLR